MRMGLSHTLKVLRFIPLLGMMYGSTALNVPVAKSQELGLPTVFRLGEYESSYRLLLKGHPATLIEVVDRSLAPRRSTRLPNMPLYTLDRRVFPSFFLLPLQSSRARANDL